VDEEEDGQQETERQTKQRQRRREMTEKTPESSNCTWSAPVTVLKFLHF